ncbi:MAG: hypothetical protein IKZ87_04965 [Actinomycetaceae bacterium]|nr:hypothetical protein [Actinomycetaceae bacterium]
MDKEQVLAAIATYNRACYAAFNEMLESIAKNAIDADGDVTEQAALAASTVVEHGADDFGEEDTIAEIIADSVSATVAA